MADRAQRKKKAKLDKLAELKRAREGGSRSWVQEADTDLYDEVSEEQYRRIVKGRLAKDDFVVDDGVGGYNDNGMDDWDQQNEAADSDEDDYRSAKCVPVLLPSFYPCSLRLFNHHSAKKKSTKDNKPRGKPKAPPPVVPASITSYRPTKTADQESDFMDMLLGNMNAIKTVPSNPSRSLKRKPSPPPKYRSNDHRSSSPIDIHDGTYSDGLHDDAAPPGDEFMSPKKKPRTDPAIKPALDRLTNLDVYSSGPEDAHIDDYDFGDNSLDELDPSAFDQVDEVKSTASKVTPKVEPTEVDVKKHKPLPVPGLPEKKKAESLNWMSYYDSLSVAKDEALGSGPSVFSSVTQDRISALEPDGSLRFFWLDYLEHDGKVHLIGKLKDKNSGVWISCCVTVENLQRNLYVLPRERRIEIDEDGDEYETDIVPRNADVYQEFDTFRKRAGVKTWKARFVQRKYAFGERDVPRGEAQWMKVVYGFDGMWFTPETNTLSQHCSYRTTNRL
jgi:DNA polymerase alpha subunit A